MRKQTFFPTLKKRAEFLTVKHKGMSWASQSFIIQCLMDEQILHDADTQETIRIGYVATKKLGNAVVRNRAKRRMRELCRAGQHLFKGTPAKYVMIARHSLLKQSFDQMLCELAWTLKHLYR